MSEVKISQLPESTTVDNTVYIPIVQGTGTDTDNYKMKPSNAITKTDITTKLGAASASNDGYLSAAGWSLFNGKLDYRTFGTAANNNTGDFYATGSTVANSTLWNGITYDGNQLNTINTYILGLRSGGIYSPTTTTAVSNWLGLGSSAYTNTNDHILNQNASAQSANMWISGLATVNELAIGSRLYPSSVNTDLVISSRGTGNIIFNNTNNTEWARISSTGAATFASTVTATQFISKLSGYGTNASPYYDKALFSSYGNPAGISFGNSGQNSHQTHIKFTVNHNDTANTPIDILRLSYNEAKFESSVNSNGFIRTNTEPIGYGANTGYLYFGSGTIDRWIGYDGSNFTLQDGNGVKTIYHSGNLTNNLSTNYIPKWNGSSMVNSQLIEVSNNTKGFFRFGDETVEFLNNSLSGYIPTRIYSSNFIFDAVGTVRIESTTPSTSPTTGALVVSGGVGVGGDINVGGSCFISPNINESLPNTSGSSQNGLIERLKIYGSNGVLDIGYAGGGTFWFQSTNAADLSDKYALLLNPNGGNVGVGYTSVQGYKLAVNGSGYFNGNITATGEITAYSSSDERLKQNIQPLNKSLDVINKLNPVSYNWNDKAKELNPNKTDKTDVGVIAQELENVLPNLVHNIYNDEFLAVDYVKLIPYLIGAIQELTDKINKLENNK